MMKKLIFVIAVACALMSACWKKKSAAAVNISKTAGEYEMLSYGEFKTETGNEAEFYHADRFIGAIPDTSLCAVYAGEYDEAAAGPVLSADALPLRIQGALGDLLDGISGEMTVDELSDALSADGGMEADCKLLEGAGTAYYVGDKYAQIQFDSDADGKYDRQLLISLDKSIDETVRSESDAWLEILIDGNAGR